MFMRLTVLYIFLFVFFSSCQSKINQTNNSSPEKKNSANQLRNLNAHGDLFSDWYDSASSLYKNSTAKHQFSFSRDWQLYVYAKNFPGKLRHQALQLKKTDQQAGINGEMTLLAHLANKGLWIRVIVEEVNLNPEEYYKIVRLANKNDLANSKYDISKLIHLAGQEMILWEYTLKAQGYPIRFVEYQTHYKTFNFRFTFWSLESMMESAREEIKLLMSSLRFI